MTIVYFQPEKTLPSSLVMNADSGIREIFLLWNPQFWALQCRIQLKEYLIAPTIGICNPSFTDKESGIQYLESRVHGWKSRIQDCLGFPYIMPIVD